jgi:hypothetical protein
MYHFDIDGWIQRPFRKKKKCIHGGTVQLRIFRDMLLCSMCGGLECRLALVLIARTRQMHTHSGIRKNACTRDLSSVCFTINPRQVRSQAKATRWKHDHLLSRSLFLLDRVSQFTTTILSSYYETEILTRVTWQLAA